MIKPKLFFLFISLAIISNSLFSQSGPVATYETNAFRISFPGHIQETTQSIASSVGNLVMKIVSYEPADSVKDENYAYMIFETNYLDSIINSAKVDLSDLFFRGAIDGAVKNVHGKLISETSGKGSKYPSRNIEIDYGNGLAIIKSQIILRENKLIMLQTITDTNHYPNQSIKQFFNSLELK